MAEKEASGVVAHTLPLFLLPAKPEFEMQELMRAAYIGEIEPFLRRLAGFNETENVDNTTYNYRNFKI